MAGGVSGTSPRALAAALARLGAVPPAHRSTAVALCSFPVGGLPPCLRIDIARRQVIGSGQTNTELDSDIRSLVH